jgi:predicted anti-sigma-YlaC factor YlaD
MVGDALASGNSVYETDEDLELVGAALPFGLKLTESLLRESPNHEGLLQTACSGFVLYSYAYVDYPAEVAMQEDIVRGRVMRARARRLYQRAIGYCLRGLDLSYDGFGGLLMSDPEAAVQRIVPGHEERDLPLLYWTAAALGLAISVSPGSAAMLARLPEVEAVLERALELEEAWNDGALHEFKVVFAGAVPGGVDYDEVRRHYDRALALSAGRSAGLHVAYAEAVSIPTQDAVEFRDMLGAALAVDPDATPDNRLVNLLAHRRAAWLIWRIDELFLDLEPVQ